MRWKSLTAAAVLLVACTPPSGTVTEEAPAPIDADAEIQRMLAEEYSIPATYPWKYSSGVDEMRGHRAYTACTIDREVDGSIVASPLTTLCLRVNHDDSVDIVVLSSEMIDCVGLDDCEIALKFDDGAVQNWRASYGQGGGDAQYNAIFLQRTNSFLEALRSAEQVIVEVRLYSSGTTQMRFETQNLVWPPPA